MIYTEPSTDGKYTEKLLFINFDTEKQCFVLSLSGPSNKFDKYFPIMEIMLIL